MEAKPYSQLGGFGSNVSPGYMSVNADCCEPLRLCGFTVMLQTNRGSKDMPWIPLSHVGFLGGESGQGLGNGSYQHSSSSVGSLLVPSSLDKE